MYRIHVTEKRMKYRDIKKQFPHQWVLIEYEDLDESLAVTSGRVLVHSSNKDEIYQALSQSFGKNVAVEYTGPVEQDLTVMFILQCHPTN